MSKVLVIAEKPELGRAIASVIVGNVNEKNGIIENENYIVTWAFGHLLELCPPEVYDESLKKWSLDALPIAFRYWKKQPPIDKVVNGEKIDNKYRRERLFLLGKLLKQVDTVIHAGDPDDEGQLLIDEILDYFHFTGTVKRVLINDNLPSNIAKQFRVLKNNEEFQNISNAANGRLMADCCFGFNHTRLATLRLNSKSVLHVGRVQTPTLNLVVQRDLSIENHQKQKYYELILDVTVNGDKGYAFKFEHSKVFDEEPHILDKSRLEELGKSLNGKLQHTEFTNKEKSIAPPLPYNATELQADMNGRYGYSLKKTLDITQVLRDKYKAITYNRSDCQYLSLEHLKEAPAVLNTVFSNLSAKYPVDYAIKSKCFDDSKITAHHGIIPQNKSINVSKMSEEERNVYFAICERYIMQFLPPIKKIMCEGIITCGDRGRFVYRTSKTIDLGYTQFFKDVELEKEQKFVTAGMYQGIVKNYKVDEKETKPLSRYTPKSLIKDMCGISKYVKDPELKKVLKEKDKDKVGENGSIGTVATRAVIVDNLVKHGFIKMQGKNVISTEKAREFLSLLPRSIKSPDTTAKWWLIQEDIKDGKADVNAVMDSVVRDFKQMKDTLYIGKQMESLKPVKEQKQGLGKCPICGSEVYENKTKDGTVFYGCCGYQKGCKFSIPSEMKYFNEKIKMNSNRVSNLLNNKTIKANITSKKGDKYLAEFKLVLSEYKGRKYPNLERIKKK